MWYVIQVFTGEEHAVLSMAEKILERNTYEDIFIPRKVICKKYLGEWHRESNILFPGYVFIESMEAEQLIQNLKKVPKYTKLLRTGDELTPITSYEENWLKRMLGTDKEVDMSVGFVEGDRLFVTEGPLMGMEGCVKKIDRHKRIAIVGIELFGRIIETTLGLEVVSKV